MEISNLVKKLCTKLGAQNKSTYPMVAIATANGICRPTFTMLKKGEDPNSKKYAALREGLTEAIAVPTYIASGELAGMLGKWIASKATDKKIKNLEAAGQVLTDIAKKEMKQTAIKKGQTGLMLIGVCAAAGIIIPSLCSVAVKPIMQKITKKQDKPNLDIKEPEIVAPQKEFTQVQRQIINTHPIFKSMTSSNLKVGGV